MTFVFSRFALDLTPTLVVTTNLMKWSSKLPHWVLGGKLNAGGTACNLKNKQIVKMYQEIIWKYNLIFAVTCFYQRCVWTMAVIYTVDLKYEEIFMKTLGIFFIKSVLSIFLYWIKLKMINLPWKRCPNICLGVQSRKNKIFNLLLYFCVHISILDF